MPDREKVIERIHDAIDYGVCVELFMDILALLKEQEEQIKKNTDIQFLMMERIDSLSDMTQLMARKLHDAGIINGDLEDMNQKYQGLNNNYERELKRLALDVLNK